MTQLLLAVALLCSAQAPAPPAISRLARFHAPAGWTQEMADADEVSFSSGPMRIEVRLLGGEGSEYASPKDFLASPAAMGPEKPRRARKIEVSGRRVWLYSHRYPAPAAGPHEAGRAARFGREEFCILPAGGWFFVLSLDRGSGPPLPPGEDDRAWKGFLSSFQLIAGQP